MTDKIEVKWIPGIVTLHSHLECPGCTAHDVYCNALERELEQSKQEIARLRLQVAADRKEAP